MEYFALEMGINYTCKEHENRAKVRQNCGIINTNVLGLPWLLSYFITANLSLQIFSAE